jgi:putative transposase
MPDYRRFRVPGGMYFFTVNLLERRLDTLVRHEDVLRSAVRVTRRERPFHIDSRVYDLSSNAVCSQLERCMMTIVYF